MEKYAPALRGRGFELLLDYFWVINGWGWLLLCDPWAVGGTAIQEVSVSFI